ncbi:hypothetical protein C8Q76DRAFT_422796 [Earliella scabrosa]|nr:hypothetical protein C8Q76DRAFT_422796 [Earliella scabrosa]
MSSSSPDPSTTNPPASVTDTGSMNGAPFFTSGVTVVLAFIAVGLFLGGGLVLFCMRRYVAYNRRRINEYERARDLDRARGWDWDGGPMVTLGVGGAGQKDFGKQPELWEILAMRAQGDRWESIQPIAAKPAVEVAANSSPQRAQDTRPLAAHAARSQNPASSSSSEPGFLHPFHVGLQDFAEQIHILRPSRDPSPRRAIPLPSLPLATPSISPPASHSQVTTDASRLQVVIGITLPVHSADKMDPPFHALGIAEVRWSGRSLETLA